MSDTQETLNNIQTEVIEVVSSLVDSFHSNSTNEDQCEAHARALSSYVKHVAKIGMTASVVGFKGFRDICVMFQDVLRSMHAANRVLKKEECELLEEWPMLVMSYLSSPADQNIRLGIIDHIRRLNKENDIAEEEYDELLTSLSDIRLSEEDMKKLDLIEATSDPKKEHVEPPAQENLSIDQYTVNALQAELKEIILDLEEPFHSSTDISLDELRYTLDYCSDRIGILALSVAETPLIGLMDVFLLVQQGLKDLQINEQILGLVQQYRELTKCILNYLNNPLSDNYRRQLVETLQKISWIMFNDESEAEQLLLLLTPYVEDSHDISRDEAVSLVSPLDDSPDIDEEEPTVDDLEEPPLETQPDNVHYDESAADTCFAEEKNKSTTVGDLSLETVVEDETTLPIATEVVLEPATEQSVQSEKSEEFSESQTGIDDTMRELLELISLDIEANKEIVSSCVSRLQISDDLQVRNEALLDFSALVERFSNAVASIGLTALSQAFEFIAKNTRLIDEHNQLVSSAYARLLSAWQELVLTYLGDFNDEATANDLVAYLCDENWIQPLEADAAVELGLSLLSPNLSVEDDDIEPRAQTATKEDVSLQLPDDVNPELLETLLSELPHYTEEFTHAINNLINGEGTIVDVEAAQRVAHTLKGSANTVGITGIATLTHHIEDILIAYSRKEMLPGTVNSDILLRAADTLEVMSESLLGLGAPPTDALEVLQLVLNLANFIDENGVSDDGLLMENIPVQVEESINKEVSEDSVEKARQENAENVLRVPASLIDELLRLSGETVIVNSQLQERLRHTMQQNHIAQQQNNLLQQLTFDLEQLVDIQGFTSQDSGLANEEFDSLEMDQYNELHTVTRRLVEAATDTQEISFAIDSELNTIDTLLVAQSRQNKANQNVVMQTRMVPVKTIVPRLSRSVRQTARLTDKKVNLKVYGDETLVDSEVLNNLIDPLMHILRNAVDHGLENEAARLAAGKEATGTIKLRFSREGDQFIVNCTDDGMGLDYNAIRQSALKQNLLDDTQNPTEEELQRLILQQGFTTRDKISQVSGRGIGMDAVYNKVLSMKGMLNIESRLGEGCSFELRLPVTFISEHALLIKLHNHKVAVSSRGIEQILYPGSGRIIEDEEGIFYEAGEERFKATHLDVSLKMGDESRESVQLTQPILLVREDDGEIRAVIIDEVVASQELVIKPLGEYVPKIAGIDGATILGDGSVAPVIDLPELLRHESDEQADITIINAQRQDEETRLCALVVDDSLSARRALAEFVEDIGYEVRAAHDGLDAIEVMQERIPDIVLLDLEMPRMNGLELSQHIRAKKETQDIPIIMITSRSTEKHRVQAESAGVNVYLTKPFAEDTLLHHIENELMIASDKAAVSP